MLAYRLPREPSTPRIAVWRRLRRLGVAQLLDGLVALPLDARNKEQLEWVAELVADGGGEATIWTSRPLVADGRSSGSAESCGASASAITSRRLNRRKHAVPWTS